MPPPPAKYEEPGYLPDTIGGPELMLDHAGTTLLYTDSTIRDEIYGWCSGCHSVAGVVTGYLPAMPDEHLPPEAKAGVTCDTCHQISGTTWENGPWGEPGNASFVIGRTIVGRRCAAGNRAVRSTRPARMSNTSSHGQRASSTPWALARPVNRSPPPCWRSITRT